MDRLSVLLCCFLCVTSSLAVDPNPMPGDGNLNPTTQPGQMTSSTSPLSNSNTFSPGSPTLTLSGGGNGGGGVGFNGNPTNSFGGATFGLSSQPTVRRCLDGAVEMNLSVASNCLGDARRVCVNGQFVCPGTINVLGFSGTTSSGKSSGLTLNGKSIASSPPPSLAADAAAAGLTADPPQNGA
eukprot:GILJ01008592.1.p1 GENE.GILJ01008592.1~~GILJ01008592.1.p1  ORF type:complete len:183 (-),score=13.48 GILJ01008592.1:96-644(-)